MSQAQVQILVRLKDMLTGGMSKMAAGARKFGTSITGFFQAIQKHWLALLAAIALVRGVVRLFHDLAGAARAQEQAVAGLNAALAAHGNYTREASAALQEYATELQLLTGIGDEVTLGVMSQMESLTKLSAEVLPDAIKATVQLANVTGMDFESAGKLMTKTLSSQMNALARYGIQIDATASQQDKLNQIMLATAAGWDIAIAKAKTFEGRLNILKSVWGDYKEVLGANITQSAALNELMTQLTKTIFNQTNQLVQHGEQGGNAFDMLVRRIVAGVAAVLKALVWIGTGIKTLVIGGKAAIALLKGVAAAVAGVILQAWRNAVKNVAEFVNKIIDLVNSATAAISKLPGITIPKVGHVSASVAGLDGSIASLGNTAGEAYLDMLDLGLELENVGVNANLALWAIEDVNNAVRKSKQNVIDYTNANKNAADSLNDVAGGGGSGSGGGSGGTAGMAIREAIGGGSIQDWLEPVVYEFKHVVENLLPWVELEEQVSVWLAGFSSVRQAMDAITASGQSLGIEFDETYRIVELFRLGILNADDALRILANSARDTADAQKRKVWNQIKDTVGSVEFGRQLGKALQSGRQETAQFAGNFMGSIAETGLLSAKGGVLGGIMSSLGFAAGPVAGLIGSLFSGLFGGLFGGKKKPEPVEVRGKVEVINLEDLALVMLGVTKRSRILASAGGVNMRMNDISRQASRLGYEAG